MAILAGTGNQSDTKSAFYNCLPEDAKLTKDNVIGEDIFIEVFHGLTLIDHNVLLSDCAMKLATQGIAVVCNLIAGSFTAVGCGEIMVQ